MPEIVIAGYGFVGKEVYRLFPSAAIYDPVLFTQPSSWQDNMLRTAGSILTDCHDFAFICVPTPQAPDGSCDISAVEDCIGKIKADTFICLSTIPPDTEVPDNLVFQPEYVASSSPYPAPLGDITKRTFVILGGKPEHTKKARRLYETVYPPTTEIFETDFKTASVIKYAENSYIATKVTYISEVARICQAYNVSYDDVRRGVFRLDPRMSEWWTYTSGKGWGGHCLPKDMSAIVKSCEKFGYDAKFLKAVIENNERHKAQ